VRRNASGDHALPSSPEGAQARARRRPQGRRKHPQCGDAVAPGGLQRKAARDTGTPMHRLPPQLPGLLEHGETGAEVGEPRQGRLAWGAAAGEGSHGKRREENTEGARGDTTPEREGGGWRARREWGRAAEQGESTADTEPTAELRGQRPGAGGEKKEDREWDRGRRAQGEGGRTEDDGRRKEDGGRLMEDGGRRTEAAARWSEREAGHDGERGRARVWRGERTTEEGTWREQEQGGTKNDDRPESRHGRM
jgi:hypothetical protein